MLAKILSNPVFHRNKVFMFMLINNELTVTQAFCNDLDAEELQLVKSSEINDQFVIVGKFELSHPILHISSIKKVTESQTQDVDAIINTVIKTAIEQSGSILRFQLNSIVYLLQAAFLIKYNHPLYHADINNNGAISPWLNEINSNFQYVVISKEDGLISNIMADKDQNGKIIWKSIEINPPKQIKEMPAEKYLFFKKCLNQLLLSSKNPNTHNHFYNIMENQKTITKNPTIQIDEIKSYFENHPEEWIWL